ncbi:MAG: hypothetical protein ACE366_05380 [Bradymonadia bacterium]
MSAALLHSEASRSWLIRAAVESPALAEAMEDVAADWLAGGTTLERAVAIHTGRALMARMLIAPVVQGLSAQDGRFVGVEDALAPGRTLAQTALDFLIQVRPRNHRASAEVLRASLAVPELRVEAWRAICADDPEGPLPYLADLILGSPELAGPIATQYALVHTDHCEAAARAVADLPEPLKRAFAEALHKHLDRIHSIKRWVYCRRILFGK